MKRYAEVPQCNKLSTVILFRLSMFKNRDCCIFVDRNIFVLKNNWASVSEPHIGELNSGISLIRVSAVSPTLVVKTEICLFIMAYGSTPYVGMAPKKNGAHIKSAQMTRSKCLR